MSTPTFEPTAFIDLTREQILSVLAGGAPPAGAHPLSAAEFNRIGLALQVMSQNLAALQGTAQTASQVQAAIQAAVTTLIGGAPAALDTFVELANALGNDPNKITALATQITGKYTKPGGGIPAADLAESYSVVLPTAGATLTADTTLIANTAVQVDATTGNVTLTLPTITRVGQRVRVRRLDGSANTVAVTGTINGVTGTVNMPFQLEIRTFVAESLTTWSVESGNTPKTALDAAYGQFLSFTDPRVGGKGDGTTDNTAAFNAAMALLALTGGTLFFPVGTYKINGVTDVVPGGVTLLGTGYDYSDPGTSASPIPPARCSILRAGAVMDRLICLGSTGTSSAAGQTRASAKNMVFDGANLAATVVKTAGRRNYIDDCQVYWGTAVGVLLAGQNSHLRGGVIAQDNTGDCVRIQGYYDNKVWDAQIRQPGTTGACVRVTGAYNTDIQRNHMWAGQNSVAKAAQGLIVIQGDVDKTLIQENTIEGVLAPEIALVTSTGATIRNTLVAGNRFYMNDGIATDTYPVVATSGAGSVVGLLISDNVVAGAENGRRYKSILELASGHSSIDRVSVRDTEAGGVLAPLSGTSYPAVRLSGVRGYDGAAVKASEDAGTLTATGDGTTKTFTIAHGLYGAPKVVQLTAGSEAAASARYVTASTTGITVTYTTAPASGASIVLYWSASLSGATTVVGGAADSTAPTIASFSATPGNTQNSLAWSASDNVAVTRSVITRGGTTVYDGSGSSFTDTGLTNGTSYTYGLTVYDAAGNSATASASATPAPASSGRTTFMSDTFSGAAASSDLNTHTADSGATWSRHPSLADTAMWIGSDARIFSRSGSGALYLSSTTPPSANQRVEADFVSLSSVTGSAAGVAARCDPTANTRYHFRRILSGGIWRLDKIVAGTQTTLASSTSTSVVAGQAYRMVLDIQGSTVVGYVDGVEVVRATDTDITAVGLVGVMAVSTTTETTGFHLDNVTASA